MREDGFTLAEILVASFMAALISVMGISLVSGSLGAHRTIETRIRYVLDLQTGLALMRADLAQIAPRRQARAPDGVLAPVFVGGGADSGAPMIALVRLGRNWPVLAKQDLDPDPDMNLDYNPGADLSYIEYVLRDGALIRRSREPVDAAFGADMIERVLLQEISNARIDYLGTEGWTEIWEGLTLPRAIALSFDTPDFTALRCVLPVGNGEIKVS